MNRKHVSAAWIRNLCLFSVALVLAISLGLRQVRAAGGHEYFGTAGRGRRAAWQPTGDEGTITGKVNFQGEAPKFKAISMDADSVCAAKHSGAVYPGGGGGQQQWHSAQRLCLREDRARG